MTTATAPQDHIIDETLDDALSTRYLSYALSTIMDRALPDVRDGLKPVHRRLLYAMLQLKLDPKSKFKKSARVVGDVIGRFHPHGELSIYDALVRLAQEFSVRYPLIDGQGNFGNVDGDNAAAMRYTEARLTDHAQSLLEGIDQDTVDFRETYDGEELEPAVLPGGFPNLLANGSTGIAVGMATSIPPHNIGELCSALLHLIKHPKASIDKLMTFLPGPDFPTGGIIIESQEAIRESYESGKGGFRVRARWHREEGARGSYVVVVTEIPYQVQKSRLVEKIADLVMSKKSPLLGDVRDESDANMRLVLEPKNRTIDAAVMMESLFRQTELESRFSLNMNVLDAHKVPGVMNVREVLNAYLAHRREVLERRTRFRLGKINQRLEVVKGYLIAFLNLDEVIRIIREEDHPKQKMIAAFKLNDVQAEAILNMRLRSLRKLEEMELKTENRALTKEKKELNALLKSDALQWKVIAGEVREARDKFGDASPIGKRRTSFEVAPELEVAHDELLITREPITVLCSEKGWIRTLKGHAEQDQEIKYKEGDKGRFFFHAETTDKLVLFGTNGRFYTLDADKLPGGRGHGEPVRLMVDLGNDHEIVSLFKHQPGRRLLVASTKGHGLQVDEDNVLAVKRGGKLILNVSGDVEARSCAFVEGNTVGVIGDNRKLLVFPLKEIPVMPRGRGVLLQRYRDGGLSDVTVFDRAQGLTCLDKGGRMHTFDKLRDWTGKRGNAGRLPPKGFPRRNRFK